MAFIHGKNTNITVDGKDLSQYTDSSEIKRSADDHDVTTYGNDAHVYAGGLLDGTFTMSGTYDSTASTGPRAVLNGILGTVVEIVRQPEGTGAGKAQDTFNALMTSYVETSPVADMVKFSVDFNISGDVDSTAQAA